ncbi:MAG: polysaccharide export protein [Opitutaceae bacterium]|nr:polysaccharide export protein [Opitutaceae bacterium]
MNSALSRSLPPSTRGLVRFRSRCSRLARAAALLGAAGLVFATGCQSTTPGVAAAPAAAAKEPEVLAIREGDVLKVSFPGAANLDTTQKVRGDGRITLDLVGEVMAAGLTPQALEQDLVSRFSSQLVSKDVRVTVVSTSFAVYVSGAVLRPGKYASDRPITALEAIMEAGGFDPIKGDARSVLVIRQENGVTKNYKLNLKLFLEGKQGENFYLRSADIVHVPEKFSIF